MSAIGRAVSGHSQEAGFQADLSPVWQEPKYLGYLPLPSKCIGTKMDWKWRWYSILGTQIYNIGI